MSCLRLHPSCSHFRATGLSAYQRSEYRSSTRSRCYRLFARRFFWCWQRANISSYRLLPEGRHPQDDYRSSSGILSFITLIISFSGTISYLVFHQKFHFFTLRIQRTSSVLPYCGQSYEFSGADRGEFKPTLLHPKMYGTPFIRLSFVFPSSFQFHLRVHFSLVGPLLLHRLHILPREFYNQSHQAAPFVNVLNLFAHIPFNPEPNFNSPPQPLFIPPTTVWLSLSSLLPPSPYPSPSRSSHPPPPPPSFYTKGRRYLYFSNLESKNGRVLCNHPILIQYRHFTSKLFKSIERRAESLLGGTCKFFVCQNPRNPASR